jgi:hypothetical protein
MPEFPEGSAARDVAIRNLHKFRRVLAWHDLAP